MPRVALRALSVGYLAAQRLTVVENGGLTTHSAFRQTLNLQLQDGRLLPLISAPSSLNHPDALRVSVPQRWDWREPSEVQRADDRLVALEWQISLQGVPVWQQENVCQPGFCVQPQTLALLENILREWCQQQNVDSVLRLLPDSSCGVPVAISPTHSDAQLAEMASQIIGFGGGLTPDGDDYLLGYFAALSASAQPEILAHRQRLAASVESRLGRTNDISRHYLARALQGHFSQALCQLIAQLSAPFSPQALRERAVRVLAVGAASGADCMAGFLHGLRNLNASAQ